MSNKGPAREKPVPIWKSIADVLQNEIGDGIYKPGAKLPTESEFVKRFKVNRHTIRHALLSLKDNGTLFSKQGSGVYVATRPAKYEIGRRVRFHQSLDQEGQKAHKTTLRIDTRIATNDEANALGIKLNSQVHIHEGLAFIDDVPVAHFISAFPAKRFPDLPAHMIEQNSVTKVFEAAGIKDYFRKQTRLTAVLCNAVIAVHLNLKPGAPLLRSISLNSDLNGEIIEYGQTWFSGNNIELVINEDENTPHATGS